MATHFKADLADANRTLTSRLIHYPWATRVKLASASDVLGYGTKPELARAYEAWLSKVQDLPGHPLAAHNAILEQARNTNEFMRLISGSGGYETWMKGEGEEKIGRGLYLGAEIVYHQVPALSGIFKVNHRVDGFYAIRDNLVARYLADVYTGEEMDELSQTISIMCFVKGTAPAGLNKPPRSTLVVPESEPDAFGIHALSGKNTIFEWGCSAGDPNIRHDDEEDPRAHGPCAISILTHDVLRHFADHDVTRLKRIFVPGISNPFYEDDVLVSSMWRVSDTKIVGRLVRQPGTPAAKVVLDQIEYDIAA